MTTGTHRLRAFLALTILALAGWWGLQRHQPPPAESPSASGFDNARAFDTLQHIAHAPHPQGSVEHQRVRNYLRQRISELGFEPQQDDQIAMNRRHGVAGRVQNLWLRKPGTASTGTVLLTAHYDSVAMGPGAGDDGAAVAALLETVRVLNTGGPLTNDLIVLLTDGEESGLLGAEAFSQHPVFAEVAVVLNFEGRGNRGPVLMFESSPGNAGLIDVAIESGAPLVSNSLTDEVYRRLPNDTDFSVYRRAGKAGLNFAFIHGLTHYHSPEDTLANLARDSLQHHGEYQLALARTLLQRDFRAEPLSTDHDRIYSLSPFGGLWHYAPATGVGLALLALLLTGAAQWRKRQHSLPAKRCALALAALLGAALLAGVLAHGLWQGLLRLHPGYGFLSNGEAYGTDWLLGALLCGALLLVFSLARRFEAALAQAALWLIGLTGLVASLLMPGAGPFLVWPALACAASQCLPEPSRGLLRALLLALVVFTVLPLLVLLKTALTPALFGPLGTLAVLYAALLGAELGACAQHLPAKRGLGLAALGLLAAALILGRYDDKHKQPNHMLYFSDATGAPLWLARAEPRAPDPWQAQFLGTSPASQDADERLSPLTGRRLQAPAPDVPLPAVLLQTLNDQAIDGGRRVTVALTVQAPILTLRVPGTRLLSLHLNGQLTGTHGSATQRLIAHPGQRWELRFDLRGDEPAELELLQQFYDLPDEQAFPREPRRENQMQAPLRQSDSRYLREVRRL